MDPVERAKALTPPYVPSSAGLPPPEGQPLPDPGRSTYATGGPVLAGRRWTVEPALHEFVPQPTAWKSFPGPIRFAGWLWAIATIVGFASAVFWAVVLIVGGGWALLSM